MSEDLSIIEAACSDSAVMDGFHNKTGWACDFRVVFNGSLQLYPHPPLRLKRPTTIPR